MTPPRPQHPRGAPHLPRSLPPLPAPGKFVAMLQHAAGLDPFRPSQCKASRSRSPLKRPGRRSASSSRPPSLSASPLCAPEPPAPSGHTPMTSLLAVPSLFKHLTPSLSLSLCLRSTTVYVYPAAGPSSSPSGRAQLTGVVRVTLSKPRRLSKVTVSLKGVADLFLSPTTHDPSTFYSTAVELDADREWSAGTHAFEWSFLLPSDLAPSGSGPSGSVAYTVQAVVDDGSVWGLWKTRQAWQVVALPAVGPADLEDLGYNFVFEGLSPDLGLFCLGLRSAVMVVGGLLRIDLTIPRLLSDTVTYSVTAYLVQTVTVTHPKRKDIHGLPSKVFWPPGRVALALVAQDGSSTPKGAAEERTPEGGTWEYHGISRLPDHKEARPSTRPGSGTLVEISHSLLIEVVYAILPPTPAPSADPMAPTPGTAGSDGCGSAPPGPSPRPRQAASELAKATKKVLSISKKVRVESCHCTLDSIVLPPYSLRMPGDGGQPGSPLSLFDDPIPPQAQANCTCSIPTDKLLDTQDPGREEQCVPTPPKLLR